MSRVFRIAVMGLCLVSLLTPLGAAEALESPIPPVPGAAFSIGDPLWRLGGSAEAVAVQGGYAYLAQGMLLHVINLSTHLVEGTISFRYPLRDVSVSGDYAYLVTSGYGDLHVVDIRDPAHPRQVGLGSLPSGGEGVAVRWPYVYVVCKFPPEMLVVFDVSTPSAPTKARGMALSANGRWAKLGATHLYVVGQRGPLGILDISDPVNPVEKSWLSMAAENLAVAEPYVYVTGGLVWPDVKIVDVSNPAQPKEVGSWDYSYTGSMLGVAALGDYLYVGYNSNGSDPSHAIHILDIQDRTNPTRAAVYATTAGLYNLLIQGQTLYIAGGPDGDFRSLDLSTPTAPLLKLYLNGPGYVEQVRVAGNRAYLSARSDYYGVRNGIWIYDLSDPLLPALVNYEDPLSRISDFVVLEPYLYAAGQSYLLIRNTNDLRTPLGFYSHDEGIFNSVAVQGSAAYALVLYKDLYIFSLADLAHPALVTTMPIASGDLVQIVAHGDRAYVVKKAERFFVLDISDPFGPEKVAEYALSGLNTVHPQGNYLYAGTMAYSGTPNGLTVLDVSQLDNIHPVGSFETLNAARAIDAVDNVALVSGYSFAHALDMASVQSPKALWSHSGPAEGASIAGLGFHALVADEELGLTVHATADGAVKPAGGDSVNVAPQEALLVTFARPMNPSSVIFTCTPNPGGWQMAWTAAGPSEEGAAGSRVLTLEHNPFTVGQSYTFRVTGGETVEGESIAPFGLTFSVVEERQVYLPLVLR